MRKKIDDLKMDTDLALRAVIGAPFLYASLPDEVKKDKSIQLWASGSDVEND